MYMCMRTLMGILRTIRENYRNKNITMSTMYMNYVDDSVLL